MIMKTLDEAMTSYKAFEKGEKLFTDLETAAVYEMPFYLRYPISETELLAENGDVIESYPGKTIQEAESWLNGGYPLERAFMETIMDDEEDEYSDDMRIAAGEGLIRKFVYKFDDDQSGKLYVEATRPFTQEEQNVVQEYLHDLHFQGWGDLSDDFNVFLDHLRTIDVWNTWDDSEKQTTFELSEIPLETYISKTDAFVEAIESLSAETNEMSL